MWFISRAFGIGLVASGLSFGPFSTAEAFAINVIPQLSVRDPRIPRGCDGTVEEDKALGTVKIDYTCVVTLPNGTVQTTTVNEFSRKWDIVGPGPFPDAAFMPGGIGAAIFGVLIAPAGVAEVSSSTGYELRRTTEFREVLSDGAVYSDSENTYTENSKWVFFRDGSSEYDYGMSRFSEGAQIYGPVSYWDDSYILSTSMRYVGDKRVRYTEANDLYRYSIGPDGEHETKVSADYTEDTKSGVYNFKQAVDGEVRVDETQTVQFNNGVNTEQEQDATEGGGGEGAAPAPAPPEAAPEPAAAPEAVPAPEAPPAENGEEAGQIAPEPTATDEASGEEVAGESAE